MTENSPYDPSIPSAATPFPPAGFPPAPQPPKRFARDLQNNWIGGVCSGIARYFGVEPGLVRIVFVVSCLLPGPQFLLYLLLWLIMPKG